MTDSLRDQLLGLGFKPAPKPERKPDASPRARDRQVHGKPMPGRPDVRDPARGPRRDDQKGRGPQARGAPRPERSHAAAGRPAAGAARSQQDIDLAKAYAIRAQREKDERIEAERLKQEQARERREARVRVAELLKDKALNDPAADIARHFDYGGKIKRIHVNAAQLKALNAGELGVVQMDGRYVLIDAALLDQVAAIFPPCIALRVDPEAPTGEDPYADPQYQVPDDLIW
jgi:uncharacterized protein YaiL (DUF2058 family)